MRRRRRGNSAAASVAPELVAQKNKIRGIISRAKSRAYAPEALDRAAEFRQLLADALASARAVGGTEANRFLQWVEKQTQAQVPSLRTTAVDSKLSTQTLERKPKSLQAELAWAAKLILSQGAVLNDFRRLAEQLEIAALSGDLSGALSQLEQIETTYGRSIWIVEARIAVIQAHVGLDAQKQYLSSIRKLSPNSLAAYLGRLFSIRNEPTTTLNSFLADAEERIQKIPQNATLRAYLRFKVVWNSHFTQRDLAGALAIAQGLSIQDLYETFIDIAQHAFVNNYSTGLRAVLLQVLSELLPAIDDCRLKKLALLLGMTVKGSLAHRPYAGVDAVISTGGTAALGVCLQELEQFPGAFKTALAAAATLSSCTGLRAPTGFCWARAIRRIAEILTFGEDYTAKMSDLERYFRNWNFSPTLRACHFSLRSALADDAELRSQYDQMAALNHQYLDAEELRLYPQQADDIGAIRNAQGRIPLLVQTAAALQAGTPLPPEVAPGFAIFYETLFASERSLVDHLTRLDGACGAVGSRALTVLVRRAYLVALFENHQIAVGLRIAVDTYFSLAVPTPLLPLSRDFAVLKWKQLKPFSALLALSIALQIAWRATGSDLLASNLRSAYAEFLAAHHLSNPTEIASSDAWPQRQIIYFLRFVAVPEVIDMSAQVKSSRAASEVRRDVCSALIQIDAANKAAYETETFAITRELAVQDGMRVLDSSRVHVDTGAITSWAVREWEPNFARYRALVEAGIGVSEQLEDILRELANKQTSAKHFLVLPDSDADLILAELLSGMRHRFLRDPNHGLDSYLSRRVRHHSMAGYLRGAVENQQLVTTKHHSDNRYLRNDHWPPLIERITEPEDRELQRILGRFCEEFDGIISNLKTDLLRIKSEEHPRGIFTINITPSMFHIIRSVAQMTFTVDAFCNVCYPIFWAALTGPLEQARSTLRVDTYNAISSAFHRLKAALRKIFSDPQRYAALSVAIQAASEEINRKIVSIADWFNRSESTQSLQEYPLEQALEICIQAAMYSLKPFAPDLSISVKSNRAISAITLVELSDLILTMLGNVRQHAKTTAAPKVAVVLEGLDDGGFSLRVESDVSPNACDSAARARVEAIRENIHQGTYVERVRDEGNSGLTKIASVALCHADGKWDFGFIGTQGFFVAVQIPASKPIEIASPAPSSALA